MKVNDILKESLDKLNPKKVLDLGIGKGRCSKRFINDSCKITGVDLKNRGIPDQISFVQSNIKEFIFKEKYDLIIASLVLHFLKKETSIRIVENMKKSTEVDGYNFILNFNQKDECSMNKKDNFYVDEEELKKLYFDWELINSGEFETEVEEHDGLAPHTHNISFILAKKIA